MNSSAYSTPRRRRPALRCRRPHGRRSPPPSPSWTRPYFYRYTPPRPLEEIEADIRAIEGDIVRMLAEVTGTGQ
jgi:hypothetical protein